MRHPCTHSQLGWNGLAQANPGSSLDDTIDAIISTLPSLRSFSLPGQHCSKRKNTNETKDSGEELDERLARQWAGPASKQSLTRRASRARYGFGAERREVRTCMSSAAQALPHNGDFALDLYELLTTAGLSTACSSKLKEPHD